MSQDNKKSFVMYQGDGSNNVFSVPMTKGKYGTISVAFVRRGLDQYEYNPDTWGLNGGLFAWDSSGTKVYTDTATPAIGAAIYDQYGVDTGDTVTAVGGATITVNTDVYTRDTLHDVDENTVLTWTGDTLQIGDYIVIERTTTRTQPFEFQNNQKHIEKSDDNLERQIQEVADKVDNALLVDPTHVIDSNKMNPVEWMKTILRSVDKSVRGFRCLDGWLDYSQDDPDIADVDKTWTHLLNTDNIKSIRERFNTVDGITVYWVEYLSSDGGWKRLSSGGGSGAVRSVNGKTGDVVLSAEDVGALPDSTVIPDAQIQSNWKQEDNTKADYIKNKPTVPTVGNGTITITQGGTTKGTFTTNQGGNTTIELDAGGAGHNVGDVFFTMRNDNELNGAVICDGATYNTTDFAGTENIGRLLEDGKIPYLSLADYATALATNGSVGVFGWDGANTTAFRVPSLNDIFIETGTAAQIGDYIAPGLPNITGDAYNTNANAGSLYLNSKSGAFKSGSRSSAKYPSPLNNGDSNTSLGFDASLSNPIYGNSVTVQPNTVRYRAMVQLAVSATDEAVETCTGVLADMAGLKDASNLTSTGKLNIINMMMPDYANAINNVGYPYTPTKDGVYLVYTDAGSGSDAVIVDGVTFDVLGPYSSVRVPVSAGTVCNVTGSIAAYAKFIPFKGA